MWFNNQFLLYGEGYVWLSIMKHMFIKKQSAAVASMKFGMEKICKNKRYLAL